MKLFSKIHVGYDFILLICVLYLFDQGNLLWLTLGAALLHELGHLSAIFLCHVPVSQIKLSAFGACISLENAITISYWKEFWIALSGPAVGFVVSAISVLCEQWVFAGLNFTLSMFNLLPIAPLDGGKMLRALFGSFFPIMVVDRVLFVVGLLVSVTIMAGCLVLSASAQCTISLVLFCAFLVGTILRD